MAVEKRKSVKHRKSIEPVIELRVSYLEFGRARPQENTPQPEWNGALDGKGIDASFSFERRKPQRIRRECH
jgi:hypothetical protein